MKILIGKIQNDVREGILLGENERFQITSVYGLETPQIRNNFGNWSGNDGGYMSSQLYGVRTITIHGFYHDETAFCEGVENARQELIKYLTIRKLYPLFFELANKDVFYAEGYLVDLKMDFTSYKYGEFQISFMCPDNGLYKCEDFGNDSSVLYTSRISQETGGGHLVPETLPALFEEGVPESVVNNKGTMNYYPKFIVIGPFTHDFTITNLTTGQSFTLESDIALNAVVEIDMNEKTVMQNGVSIASNISSDSSWIYLKPGMNRIVFESTGADDNNYIQIQYRYQVMGI